jgi:Tfp pilus assembly PilM family ATPase
MRATNSRKFAGLCLEFGETSMKAYAGESGFELELERQENGRLTVRCRDRLKERLREFLGRQHWRRQQVQCAVSARGVSLRRLSLPPASREQTRRLLLLQIEREFPLAPEALAWGYHALSSDAPSPDRSKPGQELLVAAVKREVLQEYADILRECGGSPVFTLGAYARSGLLPGTGGTCAMLDIGRTHSELAIVKGGVLESIRMIRWGGEEVTRAIERNLGVSRAQAENIKIQGRAVRDTQAVDSGEVRAIIATELRKFAESVRAHWSGQRLYLTGGAARLPDITSCFERVLGAGAVCERLDLAEGDAFSAAIAGLGKAGEGGGGEPSFVLQLDSVRNGDGPGKVARWKWAALLGFLVFGMVSVRYTESLLLKPRLAQRLAGVKAYRDSLPETEGELSFLQYLKTNQPAYLDTLSVLANAAPPGTRIETLSLNRRGDLAMRTTLRDPQQVAEFRSKLVQSGLFESVTLEEQTAAPNRQGVVARFAGRWNTSGNSQ